MNGTASEFGMTDYVRLAAPGDGFEQQFSYHGKKSYSLPLYAALCLPILPVVSEVRYLQIWPLYSAPRLADISGVRLFTARARVGSFESSDRSLNAIYDTFARNYEGLTLSGYTVSEDAGRDVPTCAHGICHLQVDCPHRERMGYGGDGHTSMAFSMATYESVCEARLVRATCGCCASGMPKLDGPRAGRILRQVGRGLGFGAGI